MTALPAEPLELRRDRLLERIQCLQPKLLVLLAPAGFGKTTFVRQLVNSADRIVVCDCADVRDDLDLARRLIESLALLDSEHERGRAMLQDGALSVAERLNVALERWRQPIDGTVVFENAEHFARVPIAREFFARLFANRPANRRVVVCTREPFRISLTRYAAPHEILVLRARDLAFDEEDVKAIFAPYLDDPAAIARITAISQGWPIAVLLLRRFAAEGRIEMLMGRLDDIAFQELRDYLRDEVVSSMDAAIRRALFVCAATPYATVADLRVLAIGEDVVEQCTELAKQSPFVSRNPAGQFTVHPLLASLLLENHVEQRNEVLRKLATVEEKERRFPRAAELLLAAGDTASAARVLAEHDVLRDHNRPVEYGRVLASLDKVLIQRYPRLWNVTVLTRLFTMKTETLLDEAESLWRTIPAESTPAQTYFILIVRVLLMSYLGLFDQALEMLENFITEVQQSDVPGELIGAYLVYLRGLLLGRMGRLVEAERDLHSALPFVEEIDVMASGTFLSLGSDIARVRGERAIERQFIERAIERARRSGAPNFMAFDYAEALIGAWFAGESQLAGEYAAKLDEVVERHKIAGFAFLAAAAQGRRAQPADTDLPTYVAFGRLISLGTTPDEAERTEIAHAAFRAAQCTQKPFVLTLAALAVALVDADRRDDFLSIAQEAAARCSSPALESAVKAIASGAAEPGMLRPFVTYLVHEHRKIVPPFAVRFVNGSVEVDGRPVSIAGRELELVLALALRREATPRSRLASMLWPDLDTPAALNALSVCLHRARAHLGRRDVIVREDDGYALHAEAFVDLWEIDRAASALRLRDSLGESQRGFLLRVWSSLRNARPASSERWEWFEPTKRRLRELRIEIAHRLAQDALERGGTQLALEIANDLIELDPCDETAREIAIRAHLQEGDRAAAMRQYRSYRETLAAELQCEPSRSITELVMQ